MDNKVLRILGWISLIMMLAGLGIELYQVPGNLRTAALGVLIGYIFALLVAPRPHVPRRGN